MRRAKANPENLPFTEYEDFSQDAFGIKKTLCRFYGKLRDIRAHSKPNGIAVEYVRMHNIEVFRENLSGDIRFAVSFDVDYLVFQKGVKKPKALQNGTTQVRYWNFPEQQFYRLYFLRSIEDKKLFIANFNQPDLLLQIAANFLPSEPRLEEAAFLRAKKILTTNGILEGAYLAFINYIQRQLKKGTQGTAQTIAVFCNLDYNGIYTPHLLILLQKKNYSKEQIKKAFNVAFAKLIRKKSKGHSTSLFILLDIRLKNIWILSSIEKLLWQTYLAAASERNVDILRRVWLRARKLNADKETLHLIYSTWRGFAEPQRQLTQPNASNALERHAR
ncbi:MAG: hypothetical protein LDLANPLL_00318 [Turneriella sp.]|nr:hypothetical protein [Turneriella sp.]